MLLPIVAGVVAGAAGIALWVQFATANGHYYAYPATVCAMAIAWAMALVGREKRGPKLQLVAMGITLVVMLVGHYFAVDALIRRLMREHPGSPSISFWQAQEKLWSPRDALFFILGLAFAGFVPHRRPLPKRQGL